MKSNDLPETKEMSHDGTKRTMHDKLWGTKHWRKIFFIAACCSIIIGAAFGIQACGPSAPMPTDAKAGSSMEYTPKDDQVNEVNLSEGIEFPWNYGWSMGISVVPGLPLQFTYKNKGFSIEVTADGTELVKWEDGKVLAAMQQPVRLSPGDTIYWRMLDPVVWAQKEDVHYVDVIVSEQAHLVGYAVIKISSNISENGGKKYVASVIKNISFPKADGQYQTISAEYVREKIRETKGKK